MEKIEFYTKLLAKLQKIRQGNMRLEDYIEEVADKLGLKCSYDLMKCPHWKHYAKCDECPYNKHINGN